MCIRDRVLASGDGPIFGFGKYHGRLLSDIAKLDPGYLDWIVYGVFNEDLKRLVDETIKR